MYSKVLVVLALAAVVHSRDLLEGANKTEARSIYDEHLQANPAIWQQSIDVFVNTTEHEVISLVNITDLRPQKDGEIQLVSGGVGYDNVSFKLRSPTILRGYDFLVQVYSILDEHQGSALGDHDHLPVSTETPRDETEKPALKTQRDVTGKTEKPRLPESKTTEGATVTYPTQPDAMTLGTGMPIVPTGKPMTKDLAMPEPVENGNPMTKEAAMPEPVENGNPKTKEIAKPKPIESDEVPEIENMPKLQPFIDFHTPSTRKPQ